MTIYSAPIDDMMFLFEKLRDNKHYHELKKYKEVNSNLAKDILEQAAKITENLILPLAKAGDDTPCAFENKEVKTPPGYKKLIKNLFKMDGPQYPAILNMADKECQKQSVYFLMKCYLLLVFLSNYIASLALVLITVYFVMVQTR